jgi:hypothetical protein
MSAFWIEAVLTTLMSAQDGFGCNILSGGLFAQKNPDRYAAAIYIRVRPDCLSRGYSVGETMPARAAKNNEPYAIRTL